MLKDKHDFKAALPSVDDAYVNTMMSEDHYKTIQTALRLADRLQSGDVSDEMAWKGAMKWGELEKFKFNHRQKACATFEAMAEQMMKEETGEC